MKGKALVSGLAIAAFAVILAAPAGADPVNAKNSTQFPVVCGGALGTIDVVTNGNGKVTPGLVTTGNLVAVPYELHITFTFTPYDNSGPFSDTTDLVKPAPKSGRLADCTINYTQAGADGTVTLSGSVRLSYSGAH